MLAITPAPDLPPDVVREAIAVGAIVFGRRRQPPRRCYSASVAPDVLDEQTADDLATWNDVERVVLGKLGLDPSHHRLTYIWSDQT